MLTQINLKNYRGFEDHTIPIRQFTIAVGENNAGKSTLVEALRLISLVTARYRNLAYRRPPTWADLPLRDVGVSPSLRGTELEFKTLYHRYGEPPAVIKATFTGGETVTMYLGGEEEIHAVLRDGAGQVVRDRSAAKDLRLPHVSAMPQVAPLVTDEQVLTEDYIRSALSSPLAPRHFRNQLYWLSEFYEEFRAVAEENWSALQVRSLHVEGSPPDQRIYLQVRNEDFVGEVGLMGHGLQMWLQTIWFLARARGSHTVILDEPDVYMHPDLQRRLVRYLRTRFQQIVLATHSVEIMSEVQAENVLIVNRRNQRSAFANDLQAVQHLLTSLGSAQNIHLTRLWAARRLLLVEGDDLPILKRVHDLLFPDRESLQVIPNMEIGGWSGWPYAVGSSMAFRNAMGQEITTYCVLDPDYHTPDQIEDRYREAQDRDVQLHVWSHKEIENYLLIPAVISRVLSARAADGGAPSPEQVELKIRQLADALEDEVLDNLANEYFLEERGSGHQAANRMARTRLAEHRERAGHIVSLVPGKKLFSKLSTWTTEEYGVSFGIGAVLNNLRRVEVPEEVGKVVAAIENRWILSELRTEGGAAPT